MTSNDNLLDEIRKEYDKILKEFEYIDNLIKTTYSYVADDIVRIRRERLQMFDREKKYFDLFFEYIHYLNSENEIKKLNYLN